MSDFAQSASGYEIVEGEPPELMGRNLNSAAHLLSSATAFFFLAFIFAYFYLRSLNNAHLWLPKHVDPSVTLGTLVMALTVASALLVRLGMLDHRAGRRSQWRLKGLVALAAGLIAVVLQFVEWTSAGFGPADGGYASVYIGWTAFNVLFILATLFWLENLLATAYRYRKIPSSARRRGKRPVTRAGLDTTLPIRSRSSAQGSSPCPSTGRSLQGWVSLRGSSSTFSKAMTSAGRGGGRARARPRLAAWQRSPRRSRTNSLLHTWRSTSCSSRLRLRSSCSLRPWTRLWRSLPRALTHPLVAWTLFNVTMVVWHIPALYDLALRNGALHVFEHCALLRDGLAVLGRRVRLGAARGMVAHRLPHDGHARRLGHRARARVCDFAAVFRVRRTAASSMGAFGARRSADRGRGDVGSRLARVYRCHHRVRLPVAGARVVSATARPGRRRLRGASCTRSSLRTFWPARS